MILGMAEPHVHSWRMTESRVLVDVEPPTKVIAEVCDTCNTRRTTEHPHTRE
jgi:hypothetical protein